LFGPYKDPYSRILGPLQQQCRGCEALGIESSQRSFDLDVALGHLLMMKLAKLQRLAKSEDVLRRLLHVLDMRRRIVDDALSVAKKSTQSHDPVSGGESCREAVRFDFRHVFSERHRAAPLDAGWI
jgi:hypothetical protein